MYREEIGRGCGWRPRYVPSDTFANPEPIVTTHSLGLPHDRFEFGAVAVTRPLQARDAPEILRILIVASPDTRRRLKLNLRCVSGGATVR